MMSNDDELAALKARVAELEARAKPPERYPTEREIAEWKDQWHQAAEARANRWWIPDRDDLQKMKAAASRADCQDIARRGAIPPPCGAGAGGTVSAVHPNPGLPGSTAWSASGNRGRW
jgi:hypothetical protein